MRTSATASKTRWSALVLLVGVGLAISAGRAVSVFEGGAGSDEQAPDLSRLDELGIGVIASMLGLERGTDAHREIESQNRELVAKFDENPTITLLHVLPAFAFLVLVPLQFSNRIRSRHLRWHRWSGRAIVLLSVPIGLSGLFFGLGMPFAGAVEASAIVVFGGLFFLSLIRGFVAIRRRDIAGHRAWMIRMSAVALGVSTVRVAGLVLILLTRSGPEAWFGWSIWVGFATTVAVAEAWIRRSGSDPGAELGAVVSAPGTT